MRLTKRDDRGRAILISDEADFQAALEKLAKLEEMTAEISGKITSIQDLLEEMKMNGKTKSVRFREKMGEKLFLTEFLNLLERYRLFER